MALFPTDERTGINSGGALTQRKTYGLINCDHWIRFVLLLSWHLHGNEKAEMIEELRTDEEIWEELTQPVRDNIEDLGTLFPYLNFTERLEWLDRLRKIPALSNINTGQLVRLVYTPPVSVN